MGRGGGGPCFWGDYPILDDGTALGRGGSISLRVLFFALSVYAILSCDRATGDSYD